MGKLTMALTYLTAIAFGLMFVYLTVISGGKLALVFGGIALVVLAVYLGWGDRG